MMNLELRVVSDFPKVTQQSKRYFTFSHPLPSPLPGAGSMSYIQNNKINRTVIKAGKNIEFTQMCFW